MTCITYARLAVLCAFFCCLSDVEGGGNGLALNDEPVTSVDEEEFQPSDL